MPEPSKIAEETWEVAFDLSERIDPDGIEDDEIVEFVRESQGITGFKIMPGSAGDAMTQDMAEEKAMQMALMWTQWMTVITGNVLDFRQAGAARVADPSGRKSRTQDAKGRNGRSAGRSLKRLTGVADVELSVLLQFASEAKKARAREYITGFILNIWQAVGEGRAEGILDEETAEGIRCLRHMLVHGSGPDQAGSELQKRVASREVTQEVSGRLQDALLDRLKVDSKGALDCASFGNVGIMRGYGDGAIGQIIEFVSRRMSLQNSTGAAVQTGVHALGEKEVAKYPFLADAGQYLRDKGFTLEQFGTDPDMAHVIRNAFERVRVAVQGGVYGSEKSSGDAALPNEVFSFLLAIVLLKLCGNQSMVRRFALGEARRAEKHLERDLADIDDTRHRLAVRIIDELFSIRIRREDKYFVIPISNYIQHSVHFHEREWKLVNRHVWNGVVHLTPHETVRLIRNELVLHISKKITGARTPEMIPGFEGYVKKLVDISKQFVVVTVDTGEYPPCIKHAIDVLERGENLPHSGRFMLATFLLARGQSVEQIAPLFKNAPDYNERITAYQLNHLAGSGGKQYSCPSCEKIRTQDLCFAIPECDNIINPMQFGKRR